MGATLSLWVFPLGTGHSHAMGSTADDFFAQTMFCRGRARARTTQMRLERQMLVVIWGMEEGVGSRWDLYPQCP